MKNYIRHRKDRRLAVNEESRHVLSGQVYSLISVLITIPLLIFIIFYLGFSHSVSYGSVEKILADQLHDVAKDMENDFVRAITISGKRGMIAASTHVITTGVPLSDSVSTLRELMLNGSINGNEHILMYGNTLDEWQEKILSISTGFNINIEYDNLEISNHDGLNLNATVDLVINVSDKKDRASIDRAIDKEVLISTEQTEDVMFALNTGGFVSRIIKRYPYHYFTKKIVTGTSSAGECSGNATFNPSDPSPSGKILVTINADGISGFAGVVSEGTDLPSVSCYVVGAGNAVSEINETILEIGHDEIFLDGDNGGGAWSLPIKTALDEKYYFNFTGDSGPTMLKRLEGIISSSANSFETFVNVPQIQNMAPHYLSSYPDQSVVAYKYFSSQHYIGATVRGFPSWFKIDSVDAAKYGLSQLKN